MQPLGHKCIYCDGNANSRDHCLPRALGEFTGAPRFRGICVACNNLIGQAEDEWLHVNPEGFFRDAYAIRRPSDYPAWDQTRQHHGKLPYRIVADHPLRDFQVLMGFDPINPSTPGPVPQLIVRKRFASREYLSIVLPDWANSPVRIERYFRKLGLLGTKFVEAYGAPDSQLLLRDTIRRLFSTVRRIHWKPGFDWKGKPFDSRIEGTRTKAFYRVTAKIAFHQFLAHPNQNQFWGSEDVFESLRSFIRDGIGEPDQHFDKRTADSPLRFGRGLRRTDISHTVLVWVRTNGEIRASVTLFHSSWRGGSTAYVRLGTIPASRIVVPGSTFGYEYQYTSNPPDHVCGIARHVGSVEYVPVPPPAHIGSGPRT